MNRNTVLAALASAAVLALSGCSSVQHGKVINMDFVPGHHSAYLRTLYGQRCANVTRTVKRGTRYVAVTSRSCVSVVTGHQTVVSYVPPVYELELRDSSGNTGWVDVTEGQYNSVRIGDQW